VTVTLAVLPDTRLEAPAVHVVPVYGDPNATGLPLPNAIENVKLEAVRPDAAWVIAAVVVLHGSEVEPRLIESSCAPVVVAAVSVSSLLKATPNTAEATSRVRRRGSPIANSTIA